MKHYTRALVTLLLFACTFASAHKYVIVTGFHPLTINQPPSSASSPEGEPGNKKPDGNTTANHNLHIQYSTALYVDSNQNIGIGTTVPKSKVHIAGNMYAVSGVTDTTVLSIGKSVNLNNLGVWLPVDGIYTTKLNHTPCIMGFVDWTVYGAAQKGLGVGIVRANRFNGLHVEYDNLTLSRDDTLTGRYQYGITAYSGAQHIDLFSFDRERAYDMSSVVSDTGKIMIRQYYTHNHRASMMLNVWDGGITLGKGLGGEEKISTPALHIDTNANTGIGTTEPTAKFHINGSLKIVTGSEGSGKILMSGPTGNADWQNPDTTIISSDSLLTLVATHRVENYSFKGTAGTWTLPALVDNIGLHIHIKNRGTGSITLVSNSAGEDLYDTRPVKSVTITAGSSVLLINDGEYWTVN
jgi:hypothetical protein